jgi:hypothetical protein
MTKIAGLLGGASPPKNLSSDRIRWPELWVVVVRICRGDGLAVIEPITFDARRKIDATMVERSINGFVVRGASCRASFVITHQDVDSSSLSPPG